jgi:2-desacetyl-2-hydroxyethyl bacteriochlorophyllide A dehydrogenase
MKGSTYQLTSSKTLALEEKIFDVHADDDILAETVYTAISPGTELAAWLGKPPLRPGNIYPRLQGYCNLARVIKLGGKVTDITVGDWVLTHQSHRSHFVVKPDDILANWSCMSDDMAQKVVTSYLFHLGYSALLKASYFPGHKLGVVGFGALGYATTELTASFGGSPIVITSRPKLAETYLNPHATFIEKNSHCCSEIHNSLDIVINTSDSWEDYLLGLKLLRVGGKMILLGFPGRGLKSPEFNPFDSSLLYDKQLSISYAGYVTEKHVNEIDVRFNLRRNMEYLSNLIVNERISTSAFSGLVVGWKDLGFLYEKLDARTSDYLGGILKWT